MGEIKYGVGARQAPQTMDDKQIAREAAYADQQIKNQNAIRTKDQLEMERQQRMLDQSRLERGRDLTEGRQRGEELFSDGSLGRISEGFSDTEMNAMRDNNLNTINQAGKTNLRAMRIQQAAQGVRGGQAVAQQAKAQNDQQAQVVGSERDLFLNNIAQRRDAQKYNIDQTNREKQARLVTEMGYGGLGSADRGAVSQRLVGEKQAAAAASSGGGGKK